MARASMKETLIQTTIRMIDEEGGCLPLNLRRIARRAGCRAPNIYNHFRDFNELLNTAHASIINDFTQELTAAINAVIRPSELIRASARSFVTYALAHKGWFNCFLFE